MVIICISPPTQSQQYIERDSRYMTQAALSFHKMYHHLILLSFPKRGYYMLSWASAWIHNCFIILKCCENYSNSTFHNPIMVLPFFIVEPKCWHHSPSCKTKACYYLLDYPDAKWDLSPFGIRHLLLDDKLGLQSPIHCQKGYKEMGEQSVDDENRTFIIHTPIEAVIRLFIPAC